jgi:hypothetical protein
MKINLFTQEFAGWLCGSPWSLAGEVSSRSNRCGLAEDGQKGWALKSKLSVTAEVWMPRPGQAPKLSRPEELEYLLKCTELKTCWGKRGMKM